MIRLKSQNIAIVKVDEVILYQQGRLQNPVLLSHPYVNDLKIDMILIETEATIHEYEEYTSLPMWEFYALARNKGRQTGSKYSYFSRNLRQKSISTSFVTLSPFQESFLDDLIQKNKKIPPIFTYESLLMYLNRSKVEDSSKPHLIFIRPAGTGLILTLLKMGVPVLSRHFKSELYLLNDLIAETVKYGARYGVSPNETEIISLDFVLEKQDEYTHFTFSQFISFLRLKWVSSLSLLQHPSVSQVRDSFRRKRLLSWGNMVLAFSFLGSLSVMLPLIFQSHYHRQQITAEIRTVEVDFSSLSQQTKDFPAMWQRLVSKVRGREISFERAGIFLSILQKLSHHFPVESEIQSIVFDGNSETNLLKIHLSSQESQKMQKLEKILKKQFPSLNVSIKQRSTGSNSHELIGNLDLAFESDLILTERVSG